MGVGCGNSFVVVVARRPPAQWRSSSGCKRVAWIHPTGIRRSASGPQATSARPRHEARASRDCFVCARGMAWCGMLSYGVAWRGTFSLKSLKRPWTSSGTVIPVIAYMWWRGGEGGRSARGTHERMEAAAPTTDNGYGGVLKPRRCNGRTSEACEGAWWCWRASHAVQRGVCAGGAPSRPRPPHAVPTPPPARGRNVPPDRYDLRRNSATDPYTPRTSASLPWPVARVQCRGESIVPAPVGARE